jgi:hypothetical protein
LPNKTVGPCFLQDQVQLMWAYVAARALPPQPLVWALQRELVDGGAASLPPRIVASALWAISKVGLGVLHWRF